MTPDVDPTVARVLDLFGQYQTLADRETESAAGPDTYGVARAQMGETIRGLLDSRGLREKFMGQIVAAQAFDTELDIQETAGTLTEDERLAARAEAPVEVKMGWVAIGFLETPDEDGPDSSLPKMLDTTVEVAAQALHGQTLRFGDKSLSVVDTLAQPEATNEHWLDSKPLFGDDPVDAYVAQYRGNPMLFLRAGEKNTCIRIVAGINETTGDKPNNAKQVCEYLGLDGETTYHLAEIEGGIELVLREQLRGQQPGATSAA